MVCNRPFENHLETFGDVIQYKLLKGVVSDFSQFAVTSITRQKT